MGCRGLLPCPWAPRKKAGVPGALRHNGWIGWIGEGAAEPLPGATLGHSDDSHQGDLGGHPKGRRGVLIHPGIPGLLLAM